MKGVENILNFLNDNWTFIVILVSIGVKLYYSVKDYLKKSKKEQQEIAWAELSNIMLSLVSEVEKDWGSKTGEIKRAEVIKQIYDKYPNLSAIAGQDEVLAQIDVMIDNALEDMRAILEGVEV